MVGYDSPKFSKPNRSEELGNPDEQEEHARKVRAFLEANAPKRKLKPSRSDAADEDNLNYEEGKESSTFDPPERAKYLALLASGVVPAFETTPGATAMDEDGYTESEYYKYMAAIDKEHHTTGTGFIRIDSNSPQNFRLSVNNPAQRSRSFKCNPAGIPPSTLPWWSPTSLFEVNLVLISECSVNPSSSCVILRSKTIE